MRLGVLDVGSNTVHLLVVDAHTGARPIPAFSHKPSSSSPTSWTGPRCPGRASAACVTSWPRHCVSRKTRGSRTSSRSRPRPSGRPRTARRSWPGSDAQTGAQINVMTGDLEEARLTFLAARRWFGWSSGRLLIIDIGGGSLEVASGIDEEPDAVASLPLGASRLTRDWLTRRPARRGGGPPPAQARPGADRPGGRRHAPARAARSRGGDLEDLPPAGPDRRGGPVGRGTVRQAGAEAGRRRGLGRTADPDDRRPNGPGCPASRPAGWRSSRQVPWWPTPSSTCSKSISWNSARGPCARASS